MFAGFRHYQKWIWLGVIVVVIPSFVVFFTDRSAMGGRSEQSEFGMINGKAITREQYTAAYKEAQLRYFFRYGTWPGKDESAKQFGWDAEQETNNRLIMLAKLTELGIEAGDQATLELASEMIDMITQGKAPDRVKALAEIERQLLNPAGMTKADFERYIRHEASLAHLISVAGIPGRLTTPQEAEYIYRRENAEVLAEAVFFSASNHLSSLTNVATEALQGFFTNRQEFYRLEERVSVNYLRLELTNFLANADEQLAKITNLAQRVDQLYMQRGTNYYKDDNGKAMAPEAAKAKIKQEVREESALVFARKKAYDLANLFPEKPTLESFKAIASSNQLTVHISKPFEKDKEPEDIKAGGNFGELAFALTPLEPVSLTPINGQDGIYLIAFHQRYPSELPKLEQVKEKVLKDFRQNQSLEMARLSGKIFYNTLTNGLAQKKAFSVLCVEGRQVSLTLPPISRATRNVDVLPPGIRLDEVKRVLLDLKPGECSQFEPTASGGMILFLRNRFPVDEARMKAELPGFMAGLRQARQFDAANDWFNRQRQGMQVSLPETKAEREAKKNSKK